MKRKLDLLPKIAVEPAATAQRNMAQRKIPSRARRHDLDTPLERGIFAAIDEPVDRFRRLNRETLYAGRSLGEETAVYGDVRQHW